MSGAERKSFLEKAAEISQKADTYMIAAGAGIYLLVSPSLGAAIIIGSVLTIIPAKAIERWFKRRRTKQK